MNIQKVLNDNTGHGHPHDSATAGPRTPSSSESFKKCICDRFMPDSQHLLPQMLNWLKDEDPLSAQRSAWATE